MQLLRGHTNKHNYNELTRLLFNCVENEILTSLQTGLKLQSSNECLTIIQLICGEKISLDKLKKKSFAFFWAFKN